MWPSLVVCTGMGVLLYRGLYEHDTTGLGRQQAAPRGNAEVRYDTAMADLTRQALAVNQAFLALGNEVFEADGARFVRNREIPAIWDCNHVAHVRAATPEEIDRLLARADAEFGHLSYRRFDVDAYTPPEFEARLSHEGYRGGDALVMVLEGGPAGEPKPCEIRPIENEADWQAYEALPEIDWRDYVDRLGR